MMFTYVNDIARQNMWRPVVNKIIFSIELNFTTNNRYLYFFHLSLPGNHRVLPANGTKFGAVLCQTLINNISHNAVDSLEGTTITT